MKSACWWLLVSCSSGVVAEQVCDTRNYALSAPAEKFRVNGDGTVSDPQSRLMWQRCSAGQAWVESSCAGDAQNFTWSSAQDIAKQVNERGAYFYNDWRLPSIRELAMIAERECKSPRINLTVFPNTPADVYWTATSRRSSEPAGSAFGLSFGADGVSYFNKAEAHHVRLVRSAP
jgi:hypothetical protein